MYNESPIKTFTNARSYVLYWFAKKGITVEEANKQAMLFNNFWLDYLDDFGVFKASSDSKAKPLGDKVLKAALESYIFSESAKNLKVLLNRYSCTAPNLEPLRQWLMAITGQDNALDLAVVAHWLWMIKRKARDLPVIWHIMPILYGEQGCGKSKAIGKLVEPLSELLIKGITMDKIGDERYSKGYSENLIIFCDELEKIEKTDANTLKNRISTDINTYRPLYSNNMITVNMRCSFIGATNLPWHESFYDATGQRRFYQINALPKSKIETVIKAMQAVQPVQIWEGIDENLNEGYMTLEVRRQLSDVQEKMTQKENELNFLLEYGLIPQNEENSVEIRGNDLYSSFSYWLKENGISYNTPKRVFTVRLERMGIKSVTRKDDNRRNINYYLINKHNGLFTENVIQEKTLKFKTGV